MRNRQGNWMDIFAVHALAIDAKKIWLGFWATLSTIIVFVAMAMLSDTLGVIDTDANIMILLFEGHFGAVLALVLPLFNPFAAGWIHFALSALFYFLLLAAWTYYGSTITRLTALQYARDDIPTLNDALEMVRKKRKAFFFAPLTPLLGVLLLALCNQIAGLIGSIPIAGPWILTVLIPIGVFPGTIVLTFIAVLGVLSFGLMLPSISIGGKDAFEGWSSAYSYLLWGFNRFITYSALAAVLGIISLLAAAGLSELFIAFMHRTVSIGLIDNSLIQTSTGSGLFRLSLMPLATGALGLQVASWVAVILSLAVRFLVPAYAFSFFFTSNTIICFLMRKHVDKVDIDEVYYEDETAIDESSTEEAQENDTGVTDEQNTTEKEEVDTESADETEPEAGPTGESNGPEMENNDAEKKEDSETGTEDEEDKDEDAAPETEEIQKENTDHKDREEGETGEEVEESKNGNDEDEEDVDEDEDEK